MIGLLVALFMVSLGVGTASLTPGEIWDALLVGGASGNGVAGGVVWDLRLPRTLAGLVVGAGLALAGVGLRGVYRNPMAEPYLLGVSGAAGLGVVIGSLLTPAGVPPIAGVALGATVGCLSALAARRLAAFTGTGNRFILVGVALGLTFLAWTVVVIFAADSPRLPTFGYFVFGGLGAVTWEALAFALPVLVVGSGMIAYRARALDLLALGDREAGGLGVDVQRVSSQVLIGAGAVAGASVALAGVIGFVGLLAALVAVRMFGPGHRSLVGVAPIIGAIFLLSSDILARWMGGVVEIPVGMVTAGVGGALLVTLIAKERSAWG